MRHIGREMVEGLRWVWGHRHVRVTALCAVSLNFFFNAFYVVIIVLAAGRGVPAGEIGLMAAMLGGGGVLGSLVAPALHRALRPYVSIMAVFWMVTLLTPLTLFVHNGYLLGALFAGMAFLAPTANTTINTHQLLLTPDALRGRLMGVMGVFVGGAAAAGPAVGGLLVEFVSGDVAVLWCTAGMTVVSLLVTFSPALRRFPAPVTV
jgi:predicted MFS family arabinose efflux permease